MNSNSEDVAEHTGLFIVSDRESFRGRQVARTWDTSRNGDDVMMRKDITTADELWEAACRHFPVISQEDQRAGIILLQELARGEPVAIAQLARALGTPTEAAVALTKESALRPFVHMKLPGRAPPLWDDFCPDPFPRTYGPQ